MIARVAIPVSRKTIRMIDKPTLDISIVLPVYDEEGNLTPLHRELTEALL